MRLTSGFLCIMLLSIFATFAYAQDKEMEKSLKQEVKRLKKEGWQVAIGSLPLEDQLRKAIKMQREENSSHQQRYVFGNAISAGSFYDAAKMQATELSKVDLAGKISSELTSAVNYMLSNGQISQKDAESGSKVILEGKSSFKQRLYNIQPVVEVYRTRNDGSVEVQIRLACKMKDAILPHSQGQDDKDDSNLIFASLTIGDSYFDGNGVEQDGDQALKWYEKAAEEGSPSAQAKMEQLKRSRPVIEWLANDDNVKSNVYRVKAGVRSTSKIKMIEITVNGQLFRDLSVVEEDGFDANIDKTVVLGEGQNVIVIKAKNAAGSSTIEKIVTYNTGKNPLPTSDKRIALIIGNSNYKDSSKSLRNPKNDATDISIKLRTLGFEVMLITDASKQTIEQKLYEFGEKAQKYDAALFYYAGHGIQNKGVNYLIPVDATLRAEDELPYHCVDANLVLDKMESARCKTKIVILDACRNNPFARSWHRSLGNENQGLSKMDAPNGIFIGYATGPGQVAQDGKGRNSPYTEALLKMMDRPNLTLGSFYIGVVNEVKRLTNDQQWPWQSNSLDGEFYFNKR